MISKVIGMRLKKIREERGYSLEKVSELTGVSKPSINNIEKLEKRHNEFMSFFYVC